METTSPQSHPPSQEQLLVRLHQLEVALQQRDALLAEQADTLRLLQERIVHLEAEIASRNNGGKGSNSPPPDWVQQNTKKPAPASGEGKKPRKKRAQHPTWQRKEPTQQI